MTKTDGAKSPSAVVSKRVKDARTALGWSVRQLAEECGKADAGWLTENVIENIEGKRRTRKVTVDDLLALAYVLDVPPLLLLLPDPGRIAVTAGVAVDPMRLVQWVNGQRPAAGSLPKVGFNRSAAPIALYRAAHDAIEAARNADRALRAARGTEGEQLADAALDGALRRLADTIRPVLLDGIVPGDLPEGWLAYMVERGWIDAGTAILAEDSDGQD